MSAVSEAVVPNLSDQAWNRMRELENLHRVVLQKHDRVVRSLDQAVLADDRRELRIAWNQYRSVVADLGRVTEDIESLKITLC